MNRNNNNNKNGSLLMTTDEVCRRIQAALDNMGRALKCPVCLSTLRQDPVVLSTCVHAFCRSCLNQSLSSSATQTKCPTCQVPCHRRRSVAEAPLLGHLAHAYQKTLRHFGLTPLHYTDALPLLTQLPPSDDTDNATPNSSTTSHTTTQDKRLRIHRHVQLSKLFARVMPSKVALEHHQAVIQANERALLKAFVPTKPQQKSNSALIMANHKVTAETTANNATNHTHRKSFKEKSVTILPTATSSHSTDGETSETTKANRNKTSEERNKKPSATKTKTQTRTATKGKAVPPLKTNATEKTVTEDNPKNDDNDEEEFFSAPSVFPSKKDGATNYGSWEKSTELARPSTLPLRSDKADLSLCIDSSLSPIQAPPDSSRTPASPIAAHFTTPTVETEIGNLDPRQDDSQKSSWKGLKTFKNRRRHRKTMPRNSLTDLKAKKVPTNKKDEEESRKPTPKARGGGGTSTTPETVGTVASSEGLMDDDEEEKECCWEVGTVINVQPRTWPGINKPGGVAKITKLHANGTHCDVRYVLGGREKNLPTKYCAKQDDDQPVIRQKKCSIPPLLLQKLQWEGFDVEGKTSPLLCPQATTTKANQAKKDKENKVPPVSRKRAHSSDSSTKKLSKDTTTSNITSRKRALPKTTVTDERNKSKKSKGNLKTSKSTNHNESSGDRRNTEESQVLEIQALSVSEQQARAGAFYESRITQAMTSKEIVVLTSGLGEDEMKLLKIFAKHSKDTGVSLKIANTFHAHRITLCVTRVNPRCDSTNLTAFSRTMKSMQCTLAGIPIVSFAWIQQCISASKVVLPRASMYVRTLPPAVPDQTNQGITLVAAAFGEKIIWKPLSDCHLLLVGISGSKQNDLTKLARQAGAQILTNESALFTQQLQVNTQAVVVCDGVLPSSLVSQLFSQSRIATNAVQLVNSSWVFDSVSAGQMVAAHLHYAPTHKTAYEVWKQLQPADSTAPV